MNQTKKRLNIIKLAISITDIETIQLQILKLTPMKSDASIQEIISLLQEGSYVKAQSLITTYIEITPDNIVQRSSHIEQVASVIHEKSVIDEFELMITPTVNTAPAQMGAKEFDTLLHSDDKEDAFFQAPQGESEAPHPEVSKKEKEEKENETFFSDTVEEEKNPREESQEVEVIQKEVKEESKEGEEDKDTEESEPFEGYQAIPHITQKLIYMEKRYPPHKSSNEKYESVDILLEKISKIGYTDEEIDEALASIKNLIVIEEEEEASELLYICASTESQFAQFMLARELYTGKLLERNIEASFALMDTLAKKDYPEALCDLGQFYENGIGVVPDLEKAEHLYKEAMEKGIKRAMKHHARLQKQSKGFF